MIRKYNLFLESINGPYYYKIDSDEFNKMWGQGGVRMGVNNQELTDKERIILSNLLNNKISYNFDVKTMGGKHTLRINMGKPINNGYSNLDYIINKVKDDWFIVSFHNTTTSFQVINYKCDQIDGLVKFIKDMILKND